jgi:arylsulfatase A
MLPTLADAAGAKLPVDVHLDGNSLTARMLDRAPPRRWVFAEHEKKYFVRNERWKLYDDGRLYDMHKDADEKQPILQTSRSSEASAAHDELQDAMDKLKHPLHQQEAPRRK